MILKKIIYIFIFVLISIAFIACGGKPNSVLYTDPVSLNKAPIISNIRTEGHNGNIDILFDIEDIEGDTASVSLYYSTDSGETFLKSDELLNNKNIQTGINKKIIWMSAGDITNEVDVLLRLVPEDYEKKGDYAYSNKFYINNLGEVFFTSLRLSASSVKIPVGSNIYFSNFKAYAVYSDSSEILVDNLVWELQTGNGVVLSDRFQAPDIAQKVELKASYNAAGVIRSTILYIDVYHTLVDIVLDPPSVAEVGGYYDLSKVKITAQYNDNQTKVVIPELWRIKSGTGQISEFNGGFVYFPDQVNYQDTVLTVTYSENGVTVEKDLSVGVTGDDVVLAFVKDVEGNSTDIQVEYTIVNPSGLVDSVEFYYSLNGGVSYTKSTNISGQFEDLAEGTYVLTWHSDTDVSSYQNSVKVKVVPIIDNIRKDHIPSELFTIDNIPRTLDRIELSVNSVNTSIGLEFDLDKVFCTAYYSDAPYRIIENVKWRLKSGVGTVTNGKYYSDIPGNTIVEAYYMEGGIAKTQDLTVIAGRKLTALTLSQDSVNIDVNATYDLSDIDVIAHFDDENITETVNSPIWTIKGGPGVLNGSEFTGILSGTSVIEASYSEGSITQKASLVIYVRPVFQNITLNPASLDLEIGEVFDLNTINKKINYTDGSSKTINNVNWSIKSGAGTLTGNDFVSNVSSSTTILTVSYTEGNNQYNQDLTVNIKPVLVSIRIDSSPFDIFASQVYDLSDLDVIAKYDDNSEKKISQNILWSVEAGAGNINGNLFNAPSVSGSTYIKATYEEISGGISFVRDDGILINILPALVNLTSNVMSHSLDIGSTKNLTDFIIYAHFDDGSSKIVTDLTYSIFSGDGVLNGPLFTAPLNSGTTVVRVAFTHGVITRYIDITFTITALLNGISLNPYNITMGMGDTLNLNSITVTASYDGKNPSSVTNVTWIITNGGGTLNGSTYTSTTSGLNVLECRYEQTTSAGYVISKTATLDIDVSAILTHLTLNPTSLNMAAETIVDLRTIGITAHYSDGSVRNVTYDAIWSIGSGAGTINGDDFEAPLSSGTSILKAEFGGISANLTINTQHRLEEIILSKSSTSLKINDSYDFSSQITVTAKYNDGVQNVIDLNDVDMEIINGNGSWQSLGIFLAPGSVPQYQSSDYTVIRFTYEENKIEKNTSFHFTIKPLLNSLSVNPVNIRIKPGDDYDLNNVSVYKNYNNLASEIAPDNVLVWSRLSGNGTVSTDMGGNYYYDNDETHKDTAELRVEYSEHGITQISSINIYVYPDLTSITLNPSTTSINAGDSYNISTQVVINSVYDNLVTELIQREDCSISLKSGSGTLNEIAGDLIYDSTGDNPGDVVEIEFSYTESSITQNAILILNVN